MTYRDACEYARMEADKSGQPVKVIFRPDLFGPLSKFGYATLRSDDTEPEDCRVDKIFRPKAGIAKQSPEQAQRERRLYQIKVQMLRAQIEAKGHNWCEHCGFKFMEHEGPMSLDLDHIILRRQFGPYVVVDGLTRGTFHVKLTPPNAKRLHGIILKFEALATPEVRERVCDPKLYTLSTEPQTLAERNREWAGLQAQTIADEESERRTADYPQAWGDVIAALKAADKLLSSCASLRDNNTHKQIQDAIRRAGQ